MEITENEVANRARLRDLQALETSRAVLTPDHSPTYSRRRSPYSRSPALAASLDGKRSQATRRYQLKNGPKSAAPVVNTPVSATMEQDLDLMMRRRRSVMSPGGLATRLDQISVSSPLRPADSPFRMDGGTIVDESREILWRGYHRSELARIGSDILRRNSMPFVNAIPTPIQTPRGSRDETADADADTVNRVLQRGRVYLGNFATADVIVKAVHLQPVGTAPSPLSSQGSPQEDKADSRPTDPIGTNLDLSTDRNISVRAKVLPVSKDRKPFMLTRKFNLDEVRTALPQRKHEMNTTGSNVSTPIDTIPTNATPTCATPTSATPLKPPFPASSEESIAARVARRARAPTTSRSARASVERDSEAVDREVSSEMAGSKQKRIMPIHVEYALRALPVLAALMISGHVRKGDTVELPLPRPEAWKAAVAYIYTGQGEVTLAMRENILYLGGRVE